MIKRLRAVTVSQWLVSFCFMTVFLIGALIIFSSRVPHVITIADVLATLVLDIFLTVLVCQSIGSDNLKEARAHAEIQQKIQMAQARRLYLTPTVASFKDLFPVEYEALNVEHPDFFKPYCKECGGLIHIDMWKSNTFDEDTGKPTSEVLGAMCPRHPKVRREITRPVDRA